MPFLTPSKVRRWCGECQQVTESLIDPFGSERCGRHEPDAALDRPDPRWQTLDDDDCDDPYCECECHG